MQKRTTNKDKRCGVKLDRKLYDDMEELRWRIRSSQADLLRRMVSLGLMLWADRLPDQPSEFERLEDHYEELRFEHNNKVG